MNTSKIGFVLKSWFLRKTEKEKALKKIKIQQVLFKCKDRRSQS